MDKASELGIGSRVRHPDYGLGVVVNVKGKYATIHHKIYGSLTTFNVLFKFPHDQFTGEKGRKE
jgi:hypothetical protein